MNDKFYFQSYDNTLGGELWASDGTDTGTVMVKDVNTISFSSDPQNFFTDGQKVYFIANDGTTGRELWSTDGTNAGTQLVKDINVGNANSVIYAGTPNGMVEFNNEVYSFGYNGTSVEFFKTNGSLAGTTVIKTLPLSSEFRTVMFLMGKSILWVLIQLADRNFCTKAMELLQELFK